MRNTVIGLAAAAAIITAGSMLSASACPYHQGYGGPGGEYGRGEYRRDFERREYPRREFGRREYRQEFEGRELSSPGVWSRRIPPSRVWSRRVQ